MKNGDKNCKCADLDCTPSEWHWGAVYKFSKTTTTTTTTMSTTTTTTTPPPSKMWELGVAGTLLAYHQHAVMSGPSLGRCGIHCMSSQSLHLGRVWQTWKQVSSHFAKVSRPVVDIRSCRAKHHGSLGSTLPLQLAMHQTARSGFIAIQTTPNWLCDNHGQDGKRPMW